MSENATVVTFVADEALYAVPVDRVQEILDLRPVAPLPSTPAYLLGVIDLRGANVPVVDLRRLLGRPDTADTAQSRILVVQVAHESAQIVLGIKTDRVIEVTALDEPELKPLAEAELLRWTGSAVAGIARCRGAVVSVLDLDRLFARPDIVAAAEAGAEAGLVGAAA